MPEVERPIEDAVRNPMNEFAKIIDRMLNPDRANKQWAFALLVFPFGRPEGNDKRANYISNGGRADILAAMKEFIARTEGRYIDPAPRNAKSG